MTAQQRLAEMGLALPAVAKPVGSYSPAVRTGALVFTAGQLPMREGKLVAAGKVPAQASIEQAAEAARVAVLNALAAAAGEAGGLERVRRIVRLNCFVNSSPLFSEQAKVANGASDLLVAIFGDAGRHSRCAIGVAELPLGASVEIDLVVEVT